MSSDARRERREPTSRRVFTLNRRCISTSPHSPNRTPIRLRWGTRVHTQRTSSKKRAPCPERERTRRDAGRGSRLRVLPERRLVFLCSEESRAGERLWETRAAVGCGEESRSFQSLPRRLSRTQADTPRDAGSNPTRTRQLQRNTKRQKRLSREEEEEKKRTKTTCYSALHPTLEEAKERNKRRCMLYRPPVSAETAGNVSLGARETDLPACLRTCKGCRRMWFRPDRRVWVRAELISQEEEREEVVDLQSSASYPIHGHGAVGASTQVIHLLSAYQWTERKKDTTRHMS